MSDDKKWKLDMGQPAAEKTTVIAVNMMGKTEAMRATVAKLKDAGHAVIEFTKDTLEKGRLMHELVESMPIPDPDWRTPKWVLDHISSPPLNQDSFTDSGAAVIDDMRAALAKLKEMGVVSADKMKLTVGGVELPALAEFKYSTEMDPAENHFLYPKLPPVTITGALTGWIGDIGEALGITPSQATREVWRLNHNVRVVFTRVLVATYETRPIYFWRAIMIRRGIRYGISEENGRLARQNTGSFQVFSTLELARQEMARQMRWVSPEDYVELLT